MPNVQRRTLLTLLCCLAASSPLAVQAAPTLEVVATTSMLGDLLRQVGGERVAVRTLMGPGIDPHTYRQVRSDIVALSRADLVVWHGLNLEAQLAPLLLSLGERQPVVALAEQLPKDTLLRDTTYDDQFDPHLWMDAQRWAALVPLARDVLITRDPDGKAYYTERADAYASQLAALDAAARTALATVPAPARVLVTAHDAFRYFGQAYGYEVLGIQGISTESEASLGAIEALVALMAQRRIGALFVETSVADQNVRAVVEGAAARGHTVVVGGELYSDALGEPDTPQAQYLGMMVHNLRTIVSALGGDPSALNAVAVP